MPARYSAGRIAPDGAQPPVPWWPALALAAVTLASFAGAPWHHRSRQRKQGLSPEDLAFLEWLKPILLNDQRQDLERLVELPAPPR